MKTYFDCIPCFAKQALSAARLATTDRQLQEKVLRRSLELLSEIDMSQPPPVMGREIHRLIRETVGVLDPYKNVKEKYNRFALDLYPELAERVRVSDNPLETAARLAIAGNIIDFGVGGSLDHEKVIQTIEGSFAASLFGDFSIFEAAAAQARDILYLGDNTGEIVFDRLLIEQLGPEGVTLAVRGGPIINDATMEDAQSVGLTEVVRVIDNGADIPGTVLSECSEEFVQYFETADMIISKGQGNYETLSNVRNDRPIFFLFQTKCRVAALDIKCDQGRLVVKRNS